MDDKNIRPADLIFERDYETILTETKEKVNTIAGEHNERGILRSGIFISAIHKKWIESIRQLSKIRLKYDIKELKASRREVRRDRVDWLDNRQAELLQKLVDNEALPNISDWCNRCSLSDVLYSQEKELYSEIDKIRATAKLNAEIALFEAESNTYSPVPGEVKSVSFRNPRHVLITSDATLYEFPFSVVDSSLAGAPEEETETQQHVVNVKISSTLASCWGLSKQDLVKVLFEYGKRHIDDKLKDGTLRDIEELSLNTVSHPTECPFNPSRISDPNQAIIDVEISEKTLVLDQTQSQLASLIIAVRDKINGIFCKKHGGKLTLINQERYLAELFREANSQEEFSYRLSALANLIRDLDNDILRSTTGTSDAALKSISLLEAYLEAIIGKTNEATYVIKILRNINKMRQGYPVHGDNVEGVLEAYKFLGIGYPIDNYQKAWKTLLEKYLSALQNLFEIIRSLVK